MTIFLPCPFFFLIDLVRGRWSVDHHPLREMAQFRPVTLSGISLGGFESSARSLKAIDRALKDAVEKCKGWTVERPARSSLHDLAG